MTTRLSRFGALTLALSGVSALFAASARAQQSPEDAGLAVAMEAENRDLGWGDNSSTLRMVLRNRNGDESTRELRRLALENNVEGEGDKSLITFDAPRDVAGTSLLSHTRILEPDDQWLFLPALERVKRISSANKSGSFVGSEFAYEDLVSQEVAKYDYRLVGEESCGELQCFVVERHPRYENSGYTKQVVWWDREHYRIQRIDFYDRKDDLLKTLTYSGYHEYLGKYWRPDRLTMENHQNGKSTELDFSDWSFATGLTAEELTPSRLRRAR